MNKLLFGTAGIPIAAKGGGTIAGIEKVRELGLDAMELEFVRNINIKKEAAPQIKESAKKNNIILTCHAPYYINLNSQDKVKLKQSIQRIVKSAQITHLCGGWSVCFHSGYYMKMEKEKVYENVKSSIKSVTGQLDSNNKVWIRPEIGGKKSSFGSLEELIHLSEELEQVLPCIDFAHFHARDNGGKKYEHYHQLLSNIEKHLGKEALKNMHCHMEGITHGEKGEKAHVNLADSDIKYKDALRALKEFHCKGIVISESPNIEQDALKMQKVFEKI